MFFNFQDQDLVKTLSCLTMIITPVFTEVSVGSKIFFEDMNQMSNNFSEF